jgi:conjugal transfer pilus assembly protein TraU
VEIKEGDQMKYVISLIFIGIFSLLNAKEGKMMNPFTDVCWECVFPITVSGFNVTPGHKDPVKSRKRICKCSGTPPRIGIPLTFWEPLYLVDVTHHAYKLVGLGGITVGKDTVKNRGTVSVIGDGPAQTSLYHVHWYTFPIFSILKLFTDFICIEPGDLSIPYLSELDPLWYDDNLALINNPEAALFSSTLAQASCIADCAAASLNKPIDELFWCAGCEGSLYPFTGTVAHHVSPMQASYLLVHRVIAKLHRSSLLKGHDKKNFCESEYMPIIKKTLYKTHLVHPIPQTSGKCHALGKSDLLWGIGKSFPVKGEDFVYLVWVKKQCCLDSTKAAATVYAGSVL